jgi:Ca2+-binding RTX toxin-like protein
VPLVLADIGSQHFSDIVMRNTGIDHMHYDAFKVSERIDLGPKEQTRDFSALPSTDAVLVLVGNERDNAITGTAASDTIYGEAGNDTLNGGHGIDALHGGNGNDVLTAGVGPLGDFAYGEDGNDTINGNSGDDNLIGGAGNDLLSGGSGKDFLSGGPGKDWLMPGTDPNMVDGGDGNDTVDYSGSSEGVNVDLRVSLKPIAGLGGYAQGDLIVSVENVVGSGFADMLIGDQGTNRLDGGDGADLLDGGGTADNMIGSAGNHAPQGSRSGDILNGGAGIDTASYEIATSGVNASLAHPARGTGDAAGDKYNSIENLTGSAFADRLMGDCEPNVLSGGPGEDTIMGGGGADTIYFANASEGIDKITHFNGDKIGLSQQGFNLTSLQDGVNFIADEAPADKVAEATILYDAKVGALSWDPDGTGSQAAMEFAVIAGHPHLTVSDFQLMA